MAWSATGFRVYLGKSESLERANFPIFAGTEIIGSQAKQREITVERAEWRGLSKAGALVKAATASWRIVQRDRIDESNQWRVTEELITTGPYVDIP